MKIFSLSHLLELAKDLYSVYLWHFDIQQNNFRPVSNIPVSIHPSCKKEIKCLSTIMQMGKLVSKIGFF